MAKEKLRFAGIGCNGMGWKDVSTIGMHDQVEMVAFCDVDALRLDKVMKGWPNRPLFNDWRKMFDEMEGKIDAVNVTVPDHNHAIITQEALKRGIHVYCQKPLTHTVWEARQIAKLAKKSGAVTRMGNQIHSEFQYRTTKLIVQQEKTIGKIKEVYTWIDATGHGRSGLLRPPEVTSTFPEALNWDVWTGPAPMRNYGGHRVYHPFAWRDWQFTGSGSMGDNGCHLLDPLYTAMNLTDPISVMATHSGMNDEVWPYAESVDFVFPGTEFTTDDTIKIHWYDGGRRPSWKFKGVPSGKEMIQPASLLVGEKGYLLLPHWGTPKLYPEADFAGVELPDPGPAHHWHDWVDACLEGNPDISDNFQYAGPLTEAVQLGNVAVRFPGQTLKWDAKNLKVTNIVEANQFLTKEYREGWEVEEA